jgi:nitroreductase
MRNFIPSFLYRFLKKAYYAMKLAPYYFYWFKFDIQCSNLFDTEKADLTGILVAGHVLEKGLTMPEFRPGFGYNRVRYVIAKSLALINKYGNNRIEIQSALKDLEQYLQIHKQKGFELPEDVEKGIVNLLKYKIIDTEPCHSVKAIDYFKKTNDFKEFAKQRHSVRWYTKENVDNETLVEVVKLAQTAPSACNKQSTKVYIIGSDDVKAKVLNIQRGNRGFGCRANKILLVTSDMECWNFQFRTSAFLDGGIFVQNLLYSLHCYNIVACTLNAELSPKEIRQLKDIIKLKKSEIPIAFIAVGYAPEVFLYPGSQRKKVENIIEFV